MRLSRRSIVSAGVIFALALPFIQLLSGAIEGHLGADPAQRIVEETGEWAINWLVVSLLMGSLHLLTRFKTFSIELWLPYRKWIGLGAFFYLVLHLLAFYFFILGADMARLTTAVTERPYIVVGVPAVLILLAMALTSNQWSRSRLKEAWGRLHNLVYVALIFVWGHLFLQVRSTYWDVVWYGGIFILLFVLKWLGGKYRMKHRAH